MKKTCISTFAVLAIGAATAYAGNVDTFGIGSKATAMGGAYSAYADDPFAAYYNPAGLTQIDRPTLVGGAHVVSPTIEMEEFYIHGRENDPKIPSSPEEAVSYSDDSPALIAPHLGFAMPITDRISFGIAAYAPWGLELEWPDNTKTNPGAYSAFHSYYNREVVTPTIAYKLNDKFSMGFGVSIGLSKSGAERIYYLLSDQQETEFKQKQAYLASAIKNADPNDPTLPTLKQQYAQVSGALVLDDAHLKLEMQDDLNYSFNLGIMYKPIETITFGLTYRSETEADFEGDAKVNGIKVADVTMNYNHPQQVQAGVRYAPHDRFSVEWDLVWTNWCINEDQVEKLTPVDGPIQLPTDKLVSERNWEDTKQIRFGMEYIATDLITLRCGYFYDPSPIPDDTLDQIWPDADKKTYSLGAGFHVTESLTIDTVFQYTDIEQGRVLGGESHNFNHAFSGVNKDHTLAHVKADGYIIGGGVTVTYRF